MSSSTSIDLLESITENPKNVGVLVGNQKCVHHHAKGMKKPAPQRVEVTAPFLEGPPLGRGPLKKFC